MYHLPFFHPFVCMSYLPSQTTSEILRNYYSFRAKSRLIQDRKQSIKTQFFAPFAPIEFTVGFSKMRYLYAPTKTVMRDAIKPAVVYLQAKVAIRKISVALSPGNALNIVLVSPKLSSHLPQFMSFQVVLLLQANLAPYVRILFAVSMPTELTIVQIHPEIMSVTLQLRTVALQIPEELQKLAFSLIELGSVIYILQHQQLGINQLNLTLHLHVPQRYH